MFRNISSTSKADSRSKVRDFSAFYTTTAHKYPPQGHTLSQGTYRTALHHTSIMIDPNLPSY